MGDRVGRRRLLSLAATGGIGIAAGCADVLGSGEEGTPARDRDPPTSTDPEDCTRSSVDPLDPSADAWARYRADSRNTGTNLGGEGPSLDGELRELEAFSRLPPISHPVVGTDHIYTAVGETVYALDSPNGLERWRHEARFGFDDPTVAGDTLLYDPGYGVAAVEGATGERHWVYAPDDRTGLLGAAGDLVCIATGGDLTGLGLACGTERWSHSLDRTARGFAVRDDAVFWRVKFEVRAFDVAAGNLRWRARFEDETVGPAVVVEDTVVVRTVSGEVVALDAAEGTVRWRYDLDGYGQYAPVVSPDAVYVVDGDHESHRLVALSRTTGERLWFRDLGRTVAPPSLASNGLYVLDGDGLHRLDPASGAVLATAEDRYADTSRLLVAHGALFYLVGDESGDVLYSLTDAPE